MFRFCFRSPLYTGVMLWQDMNSFFLNNPSFKFHDAAGLSYISGMLKEQTMFAAEYPRLAASCPVSKPSPTSPHLPYGNPACVLSLSAAWTHTTKTHPGVNLDHDGNYCLCVQPVGGYCPLREESSSRFCLLTLEKTAREVGRGGRRETGRRR